MTQSFFYEKIKINFKFLLNKYELFLIAPIIFNFIFNLFNGAIYKFSFFNIFDIFSSFLLFIFLYQVGKLLQCKFPGITISFGIYIYIVSFFMFESLILFIFLDVDLKTSFIAVNLIWIFIFLIGNLKYKNLFYVFFTYLIQILFNRSYFGNFSKNLNILGDVNDVFFRQTENIYNFSFFYSVTNPVIEGYPQFLSYIDSLLFMISFNSSEYLFMQTNSLVFFWLTLFLIYEMPLNKYFKYFSMVVFASIVLNSGWLQFLFLSSLMSERIAGYIFFAGLFCILNSKHDTKIQKLIFLFLGFNFYNKQFFSIFTVLLLIYFVINKEYRKNSFYLIFPILLKQLSYSTYFIGIAKDRHISQLDLKDTIIDLILFRNVNYSNIKTIFINLVVDKPITYLLIILILLIVCKLIVKIKFDQSQIIYISLIISNLVFILLLYSSVWRNMELLSPVRYIYSFLIIYIYMFTKTLEQLKEK